MHLGAPRLGDLQCECADAAGRAVDKNLLFRPHAAAIAKALQRREPCDRHRGSLLERQVRRLPIDRRACDHVLRERTALAAVHLVARHKVGDAVADRLDDSGEVAAQAARPGLSEPHQRARDVRTPAEPIPVDGVQRRRVDTHEHLSLRRLRLLDIPHDERSVPWDECSPHHRFITFLTA